MEKYKLQAINQINLVLKKKLIGKEIKVQNEVIEIILVKEVYPKIDFGLIDKSTFFKGKTFEISYEGTIRLLKKPENGSTLTDYTFIVDHAKFKFLKDKEEVKMVNLGNIELGYAMF